MTVLRLSLEIDIDNENKFKKYLEIKDIPVSPQTIIKQFEYGFNEEQFSIHQESTSQDYQDAYEKLRKTSIQIGSYPEIPFRDIEYFVTIFIGEY